MQEIQTGRPVFCYSYEPLQTKRGADDGGFAVNIFDNNLLVFEMFSANKQPTYHCTYPLPEQFLQNYTQLLDNSRWWLAAFPLHMSSGKHPAYISRIGLDHCPELFRLDDIPALLNCSFRTACGHYTRMMYNLLEDISSWLYSYGLDLSLTGFTPDSGRVKPLEHLQQQPQTIYDPPQQKLG